MTALTKADVLAEDQLFAPLDPVTRKIWEEGTTYLITDTVGFVNRLPHGLVEAFRSTLDEAKEADLLLIVTDASDPMVHAQFEAAKSVLKEIGAANIPYIVVINKIDKSHALHFPEGKFERVLISAKTGQGLAELKEKIKDKLNIKTEGREEW